MKAALSGSNFDGVAVKLIDVTLALKTGIHDELNP